MGPRRWGRGRPPAPPPCRPAQTRLQWGRDDGVAEDRGPPRQRGGQGHASMGPRRWGRGRRKVSHLGVGHVAASMGPRRWGRGRRAPDEVLAAALVRFNGAATMGSRKTSWSELRPGLGFTWLQWGRDDGVAEDVAMLRIRLLLVQLQWGRDDGVAEDAKFGQRGFRIASASMGPRRWGRGRLRADRQGQVGRIRFNGAATMGSRKTRADRHRGQSAWECFNGAATMGSRKTWPTSAGRTLADCFNGAATMGSRKTRPLAVAGQTVIRASMGPRRWGRGRHRIDDVNS